MSQTPLRQVLAALLVLTAITLSTLVLHQVKAVTLAQSGQGYDLSWWTVDGGSITYGGSNEYTLNGTIGQHDAGVLGGEGYTLVGGFWGGIATQHNVYLPLILREQ